MIVVLLCNILNLRQLHLVLFASLQKNSMREAVENIWFFNTACYEFIFIKNIFFKLKAFQTFLELICKNR